MEEKLTRVGINKIAERATALIKLEVGNDLELIKVVLSTCEDQIWIEQKLDEIQSRQ